MKKFKFVKSILILGMFLLSFIGVRWEVSADEPIYWQFSVPVELKDLVPQVKTVLVQANVFDKNDKLVAKGFSVETIPADGNLTKTFVIKADSYAGGDPMKGVKYAVFMMLNNGNDYSAPNANEYSWTKSKFGTTLVDKIEGKLP